MTVKPFVFSALLLVFARALAAGIPVTVAPLGEQLVALELRAPASVVAANEARITAEVTALVREVAADVGASVRKGDLLVQLDDRDARLALGRARADLEALQAQIAQAELRQKRGEELRADNYISEEELIERRTSLLVLRANLASQRQAIASAELTLERTRVTAPYDATVVARSAQVGGLALPGTALMTLVQTGNREVDADLDSRFAGRIAQAGSLRFISQRESWPLTFARLSEVIDTESRIQKARFRFTDGVAPIGASGEVAWEDAAGLVPVPLIVQRDGQLGIFTADGNLARFVPLPMAQEGRPARHELPPDTPVVMRGQTRLQDGDELAISRQ